MLLRAVLLDAVLLDAVLPDAPAAGGAEGTGFTDDVERARASRITNPVARRQFLAGRAWLRGLVAELTGLPGFRLASSFSCPQCAGTDHGRPGYLFDGIRVDVAVSLSRCGGWAVAALGRESAPALGIDIEAARRFAGGDIDSTVFTAAERTAFSLTAEPERNALRARFWARKEAVVKAAGVGLTLDPITVDVSGPAPFRAGEAAGRFSVRDIAPETLGVPAGFAVALAADEAGMERLRGGSQGSGGRTS